MGPNRCDLLTALRRALTAGVLLAAAGLAPLVQAQPLGLGRGAPTDGGQEQGAAQCSACLASKDWGDEGHGKPPVVKTGNHLASQEQGGEGVNARHVLRCAMVPPPPRRSVARALQVMTKHDKPSRR